MDIETLATHEGFDLFKATIRSTYGKAKRRRLIAEAIRELLALDSDIDAAEARIRAAKALGLAADDLELRADRLLANARRHKRSAAERKPARGTTRKSAIHVTRRKTR